MVERIVYIPAFVDQFRHGGVKRSDQIRETLEAFECTEIRLQESKVWQVLFRPSVLSRTIWNFFTLPSLGFRWLTRAKQSAHLAILSRKVDSIGQLGGVVIEYGSGPSRYAPQYFSQRNIPYILAQQNLEFLVPGTPPNRYCGSEYILERQAIERAQHCITISEQDARLTRIYNRNTSTLPYYPAGPERENIEVLRQHRAKLSLGGDYIIMMGTAINPPTREGMQSFLNWLEAQPHEVCGMHVYIVGFATDIYFKNGRNHTVLGALSREKLNELLVNCAFVLLNQLCTSGFLTRLVDLNLAGIPVVISNDYIQARDLEAYGIYTYSRFDDISKQCVKLSNEQSSLVFSRPMALSNFDDIKVSQALNHEQRNDENSSTAQT